MKLNPRHQRSPKNLKVNDVFKDWKMAPSSVDKGGIFFFLSGLHVPWETYTTVGGVESHSITWQLDIAYHGEQSGDKFVSPLVYHYLDDEGELTSQNALYIASALVYRYREKWQHLWDLYHSEYNPMENYRMTDSGEDTIEESGEFSRTRTPNLTKTTTHPTKTVQTDSERTPDLTEAISAEESVDTTYEGTSETTHGHVIGTQEAGTDNVSNSRFGFNSAEAVPTDTSAESKSRTQTETHSGKDTTEDDSTEGVSKESSQTKTTSGTDTNTTTEVESFTGQDKVVDTGTETNEDESSSTKTVTYGRVKSGIMYQTPAAIMEADREFWLDDYFAIVFDDVDAFLTLSIYSEKKIHHKVYTD